MPNGLAHHYNEEVRESNCITFKYYSAKFKSSFGDKIAGFCFTLSQFELSVNIVADIAQLLFHHSVRIRFCFTR